MNLGELNLKERKRSFLFYGESGVGKTCLAASFPGLIRYFDFDNKISSVADFYSGNKELLNNIDYSSYPQGAGLKPYRNFAMDLNKFDDEAKTGKYKTAVFDSISAFVDIILKEEMSVMDRKKPRASFHGLAQPDMADYGMAINFIKDTTNAILSTNVQYIVFTGHIRRFELEGGGTQNTIATYSADLRAFFPKVFEEVYRLHKKVPLGSTEPKFTAQTVGTNAYVARSQIKKLENNFDYSTGFNSISKCF